MNNKTNGFKTRISDEARFLYDKLKQERDELKLKVHLGKAELSEQWDAAEEQWERLKSKSATIGKSVDAAGEDLEDSLKTLGSDLKKAYKKIRAGIDSSKMNK